MAIDVFIGQLYTRILGREADSEGSAYWIEQLDSGAQNAADVTQAFVQSTEYSELVAPIVRLYLSALGRTPDAEGLAYWVQQVHAGRSLQEICVSFADTDEYRQLYDSAQDDNAFVEQLYQNAMGRAPAGDGTIYWQNGLDTGSLSRVDVLVGFVSSQAMAEARADEVDVIAQYHGTLNRAPTQAEVDSALGSGDPVGQITQLYANQQYRGEVVPGLSQAGVVVDGYVSGATVTMTLSDGTVRTTTTDENGNFDFGAEAGFGKLVMTGGTDISTGQPFEGTMTAPAGATVVNPITTLIDQYTDIRYGSSPSPKKLKKAKKAVLEKLGLETSVDALNFDPMKEASRTDTDSAATENALKFQAAATQINTLVTQVAALLEGAGAAADEAVGGDAAIRALAEIVTTDTVDLSSTETIKQVTSGAAGKAGADSGSQARVDALADEAAQTVANLNQAIQNAVDSAGTDHTGALQEIAQVQVVAESVEDKLESGAANDDLTTARESTEGSQFTEAVAAEKDNVSVKDGVGAVYQPKVTPDTDAPTATLSYSTDTGLSDDSSAGSTLAAKQGDTLRIFARFNEGIRDVDGATLSVHDGQSETVSAAAMVKVSTTLYYYDFAVPTGDFTGTVTIGAATDGANNTISAAPTNAIFTVDNTAPVITLSGLSLSDDTGSDSSDAVTKTAGQTVSATLSQTLAAGEAVYGSVDGGSNWTDITDKVSGTSLSWNGVTLINGSHSLQLQVRDAVGNEGAVAGLSYTLDTTQPAVATSSPISGGTGSNDGSYDAGDKIIFKFSEPVKVAGLAADATGITVTNGHSLGGSATLAATDASNGYATTFEITLGTGPSVVAADTLTIAAANVEDVAGNTASGNAVFTVPDLTPPTATVATATIRPADNAVVQSSETGTAYLVNSSVAVTDVASITSAGDSNYNQVTINAADTNTNLIATGLTDGTYKVYTVDASSNLSSASTNTVTVDGTVPVVDGSAPIVAGTGSNDGSYDAGDKITLKFSEPVKVVSLTADASGITVSNGHTLGTSAALAATDAANGYARTFEITLGTGPTVVAADTLTIAAANVEDVAGNITSGDAVFTVPDLTPPTATVAAATIRPADNAVVQSTETGTAYLVNSSVTVTDVASITSSGDDNYNQVTVSVADTGTNLAATGLIDGTYRVYAVDGAGNLSSASTNTVTVDGTVPTVEGSTPIVAGTGTNDGRYDAGDKITLKFSEPVKIAGLAADASGITVANGHTLGANATLAATDASNGYATTFDITLGSSPTVAAADTLTIAAANVEDVAGNVASGDTAFTVPVLTDSVAPTASVTTATIKPADNAVVQSTETGTAYLVNSSVAVTDVASITSAGDSNYNQVTINAADTNTNLIATGLTDGTYKVYTVDAAGNLSSASTNTVTVDGTVPAVDGSAPIVAGTGSNDSSYDAGDKITLKFSEPVKVASLAADAGGITVSNGHTLGTSATLAATDAANGYARTFEITLGTGPTVVAADTLTIAAANVEDVAGNTASGDAAFSVPDLTPPTATVSTETIRPADNAVVQSSETGTAYLVNTNVTVTDVVSITGAGDSNYNQVTISAANTNTNLAATGLKDGTYRVYAVDGAGNLSSASTNTVTVDGTAPTASVTTATIKPEENAVVQSTETGTAYLVNSSITVNSLTDITGAADDQWNEVAITSANQNTNLVATGLADGTYKVYTTDAVGNLSEASTNSVTLASTVSPGDAVIDLGSYGKLIAPVQVEGKWYYHWDRSGDGTSNNSGSLNDGKDWVTHNVLDGIFTYASDFTTQNPSSNTTNDYRYAILNGVKVALPTHGDSSGQEFRHGTAIDSGEVVNNTYDDLLAIWDAHNGSGTGKSVDGAPPGWYSGGGYTYWSATPITASSARHTEVYLGVGMVNDAYDDYFRYVALEVIGVE